MKRKTTPLLILTLFLLMLVTGVFWGTWFTLTRSLEEFTAVEFIHIGKTIISNVAWPMRVLMPLTILCMIMCAFTPKYKKNKGLYWSSLTMVLIVLLVTLLVLVPIDNELKTWTKATVPSNFEEIRDKWKTFHAYRTFLSLGSFVCFLFFALTGNTQKEA